MLLQVDLPALPGVDAFATLFAEESGLILEVTLLLKTPILHDQLSAPNICLRACARDVALPHAWTDVVVRLNGSR